MLEEISTPKSHPYSLGIPPGPASKQHKMGLPEAVGGDVITSPPTSHFTCGIPSILLTMTYDEWEAHGGRGTTQEWPALHPSTPRASPDVHTNTTG